MELKIIIFILLIVILILYLCNCKKTEHLTISESQTIYEELKATYSDNIFDLLNILEDIESDPNGKLNDFLYNLFFYDYQGNLQNNFTLIIKKQDGNTISNITIDNLGTKTNFDARDYNTNVDMFFNEILTLYSYTSEEDSSTEEEKYEYLNKLETKTLDSDIDKIIFKFIDVDIVNESKWGSSLLYNNKEAMVKGDDKISYSAENYVYAYYFLANEDKVIVIESFKTLFKIKDSLIENIKILKDMIIKNFFQDFNVSDYLIKIEYDEVDIDEDLNNKINITNYPLTPKFKENIKIDDNATFDGTPTPTPTPTPTGIFANSNSIKEASEFYFFKHSKNLQDENKSFKKIIATKITELSKLEQDKDTLLLLIFLLNVYQISMDYLNNLTDDYDEILPYLEMYLSPELNNSYPDDAFKQSLKNLVLEIYKIKLIDELITYKSKPLNETMSDSGDKITYTYTYSAFTTNLFDKATNIGKTLTLTSPISITYNTTFNTAILGITYDNLKQKKKELLNNIDTVLINDLLSKGSISKYNITNAIDSYFRADVNDESTRDLSVQQINEELTKILDDGIKKTTGYALQSINITSNDVEYAPV
tara:strand:- start:821 stop:2602 length:1782 start_codon:yes stop_codon:yes gene_type:complete